MSKMILKTKRLYLKIIDLEDAKKVYNIIKTSDVHKTTTIPNPENNSLKKTIDFIKSSKNEGEFHFVILDKDFEILGMISISVYEKGGSLGYWLKEESRGNGYITEALIKIIDFSFEYLLLEKVYAGYFIKNIASKNVMLRAGMGNEKKLDNYHKEDGTVYELNSLSLSKDDWLKI